MHDKYDLVFTWCSTELEHHPLSSQLVVDLSEALELVVDNSLLLGIQEDLGDLRAIGLCADTLADDLSWVNEITEKVLVNGGKSAGSWALLGSSGSARWDWEDSSLSNEDDVAVRELLLELAGKTLLNLVESLQKWHWNEDDDSLLAGSDLNLLSAGELQWSQGSLEVRGLGLEIKESLGDAELELRWVRMRGRVVCDLDGGHFHG